MKKYLKIILAISFLITPAANIHAEDNSWWKSIKWAAGEIRDPLVVIGSLFSLWLKIRELTAKPEKEHISAQELEAEARERLRAAETVEEELEAQKMLEDARKLRDLEIAAAKQHHKTEEMVDEFRYQMAKKDLSELFENKSEGDTPGETLAQQNGVKPA